MAVDIVCGNTKKLADELKVSLQNIIPLGTNTLYSWHANLFAYNRKKCAILMNDKTRFCFILYGLKKEHFNDFDRVVKDAIAENFAAEGVGQAVIEKYIQESCNILYTKTSDRSTLGQMNDIAYEYLIAQFADDAGKKGGEFFTPKEVISDFLFCLWLTASGRIKGKHDFGKPDKFSRLYPC